MTLLNTFFAARLLRPSTLHSDLKCVLKFKTLISMFPSNNKIDNCSHDYHDQGENDPGDACQSLPAPVVELGKLTCCPPVVSKEACKVEGRLS